MPSVLIMSSDAISIKIQARLLGALLAKNGFNVGLYTASSSMDAGRYSAFMNPQYIVYFYDPFLYPVIPTYLNSRHVIFYWTADGIPYSPIQKARLKSMCNMGTNIVNSMLSKANMEAIGCNISDVIHNAIDWMSLHNAVNAKPTYTFGVNALYNYGGNKWYMDRKGYPALIGMLYRLYSKGLKFTAWINTNDEMLTFIGSKFNVRNLIAHKVDYNAIVTVWQNTYDSGRFFSINSEPTYDKPVKITMSGSIKDISEFYGSIHYYLMNSYVEGFGVPSIEALASGRFVIANDIPTWHELVNTYDLHDCTRLIPIHAHKEYIWGIGDNKLQMDFNIPDFNEWMNVLEGAVYHNIKWNPGECSDKVRPLDYTFTYSKFLKYITV